MKKIISIFLILCFCNYSCLPVLSKNIENQIPKKSAIYRAINNGDINSIKSYVEAGFNLNDIYHGKPLISVAISKNQNEIFDYFLDNGAQVNLANTKMSPLRVAILYNNFYVAKRLIEKGANVNNAFKNVRDCDFGIEKSIINRNNDMLDLFLDNGGNPNMKDNTNTPFLFLAIIQKNTYAVKQLLKYGADKNYVVSYVLTKDTILNHGMYLAILYRNLELMDVLVNNGGNPSAIYSSTPLLSYAVTTNNPQMAEKLIECGATQIEESEKLARYLNHKDVIHVFDNVKRQKNKDFNNSIELLKNTVLGSIFYDYIQGKNKTKKPIIIEYKNLKELGEQYKDLLGIGYQYADDQLYLYINNNLKKSSPEALATLIASLSIHQDKKDSINEEIYSAMLQAALWTDYTKRNPKLRLEQSSLVNTLNYYTDYWEAHNYDINAFKSLIKSNPTYKSLPQSSRGFSNKDIGLLNDKSLIQKTTENVANYCKTHDIGTKLADAFEVIAILGLVALEAAAAYNAASIPTYTPVVMQPAPQVRPMVVPNWKYTFNAKIKHVDRYYNSVTIRSFY